MKMQKKMIVRFLAIFVLWIGGMHVCMADCSGCNDVCSNCSGSGDVCFDAITNADGCACYGPICLNPSTPDGPFATAYCVDPADFMIYDQSSLGECPTGEIWYSNALPLSDASLLLLFLLGTYGIVIYCKRRYQSQTA